MQVRLSVLLRYQNQAELDALVEAQADRGSPYFRRYLTNAQFNAYFAPSMESYRRVAQVLTSSGLQIVQTFGNRTIIEATGPSAAAERLFATRIDFGLQDGYGRRCKNVTDAIMPPPLRGLVAAVTGLDDLESFRPRIQIVYGGTAAPPSGHVPLRGPNGELGPLGFSRAYDEPNQHGYDGSGRAIASSYAGDINNDDLRRFLKFFKIAAAHKLRRITVDGGRLGRGDVETTLDIEAMIGTAPGAQVYLYSFRDFTEAYAVDVYNKIVDDNLVDAVKLELGWMRVFQKDSARPRIRASRQFDFRTGLGEGHYLLNCNR